jgi:hypothetical protein
MALKKVKRKVGAAKKPKASKKSLKRANNIRVRLPRQVPVGARNFIVVYGMKLEPDIITRAAVEAFNKRRYTVHDIRLMEYIPDPKFRNLMVKIAVLDRIQEELLRMYPEVNVIRPNTVTLMVR